MIIGLDANIYSYPKTGCAVYAHNLIQSLRALSEQDLFKFYSFGFLKKIPHGACFEIAKHPLNRIYPIIKIPRPLLYLMWKYINRPELESIIGDVDIVHGLTIWIPATSKAKKIVTIYDLTPLTHPQAHKTADRLKFSKLINHAIKTSDAILTISESTKNDLINYLGIKKNKITVTYIGIDHNVYKNINDFKYVEKVKLKYSISKRYLYYLGTIEPRKNVDVLLKAFLTVKEKTGADFQLVISGMVGWMVDDLMETIFSYMASGDLIYTGFIDNDEAVALYNGATVFVYPSQYEGFGIPVAEAMACGCPVITSDSSSLPEVVGGAGLLVEPNNSEALADAMLKVLNSSDLQISMRDKGLERAKKFNWMNAAQITKKVYEQLL